MKRNSHVDGLQGWSIGACYPWSVVVIERYSEAQNAGLLEVVYRAQNLITGEYSDHKSDCAAQTYCNRMIWAASIAA